MQTVSLLRGLGSDFRTLVTSMPLTTTTVTGPQPGECSADGQFIFKGEANGVPAHWERLRVGQTCTTYSSGAGPVVRDHTGENAVPQGGVAVTDTPSLRTLRHKRTLLLDRLSKTSIRELIALGPTLPVCPDTSIESNGNCYNRSPQPSLFTMTLAPGSFEVLGVVFHVSELLANGRFEKNAFVPDADQRFLLEMAILDASERKYGDKSGGIQFLIDHFGGDLMISAPGFSLNPITPTEEEMTMGGGYEKWRARGGYPISRAVLRGQEPINETGWSFPMCASIKCACPTEQPRWDGWREAGLIEPDQQISLWPRCIGGVLAKDGLKTGIQTDSIVWNVFVAQSDTDTNQFYLHLANIDRSWTDKMAGWVGEQLQKLAKMFCATQPAVQAQTTAAMSKKCFDKNQKPCTEGTAGCTCVSPSSAQQASVNAFNMWTSHWCSEFAKETTGPGYSEADIPQVPAELQPKPIPWGMIAAGVLAVGGVAALVLASPKRQRA